MSRNIELKARCHDLAKAREAARRVGATFTVLLEQTDTYFNTTSGRLKLREIAGQRAELIAYHRPDCAEVRGCDYTVVGVADAKGLLVALSATLGRRCQVIKRRELWMYQNVRIHLDEVQGLGNFVEFEAVLGENDSDTDGQAKVGFLSRALGIGAGDVLAGSYGEMIGEG